MTISASVSSETITATVVGDEVSAAVSDSVLTVDVGTGAVSLLWDEITGKPTTIAGYGITDAVSSSDPRLTDSRNPLSHASSHSVSGSDPVSLEVSQINVSSQANALTFRSAIRITYGSAAPVGGNDGDIYLQFA